MLKNSYSITEIQKRNALLQTCLRPNECSLKIEDEYPNVLSVNNQKNSYSLYIDGELSLMQIFQRHVKLEDGSNIKVGLIGNVATHRSHQGKGHIRSLLLELENCRKKRYESSHFME